MSPLRAATSGATGLFSSPIGIPRLAIRVGAAASTIIRCHQAGNKTRHAARRPHVRFGRLSTLWTWQMMAALSIQFVRFHVPDDRLPPISNVHPFDADDLRAATPQPTQRLN